MPQPPTLSLSNFLNSAASSSRRKVGYIDTSTPGNRQPSSSPADFPPSQRSHAEITRSESRSASPPISYKRRRISPSSRSSQHLFSPSPSPQPALTRFHGDGYDYRRPVMSQPRSHPSRNLSRTAIDLTLDSDSSTDSDSPPPSPQPSHSNRRQSRHVSRSERGSRAPPFIQTTEEETHEVIDLSDDSDFQIQEFAPTADRRPTPFRQSSSPEVEIVHERPAPVGSRRVSPERRERPERFPAHLPHVPLPSPPPMERSTFGYFPEIIRRSTRFMLGNMPTPWQVPQDHREQLRQINEQARQRHEFRDDFVINLDYRRPAFALGGLEMFERTSETPQVVQEPYKAPTPAKEGFIRTFTEDSVVLCPMCGDELATGANDTKQQVWVVKGCGHVYCGDCATNRHVSKSKKDKKVAPSKSIPFKTCAVEGCDSKVGHKTAMFPIYL